MRLALLAPASARIVKGRNARFLHLGTAIGAKSSLRKQKASLDEGEQYNIEWLNKVVDALDRNVVPGRGQTDFFFYVLGLCGHLKALWPGRRIHEHLVRMGNMRHGKSIVNMYMKCGSLEEARGMFNLLRTRDVPVWSSLAAAYAKQGRWQEVIRLLEAMETSMSPAKVVYFAVMKAFCSPECLPGARLIHNRIVEIAGDDNEIVVKAALVEMYGRCGGLEDARKLFDSVPQFSLVVWNAMIAAYVQNGHFKLALGLFWEMRKLELRGDNVTLTYALKACTGGGDLQAGKLVHKAAQEYGYRSDKLVNKWLVHMYGKCGSLEDARKIFDEMGHQKDATACSKLISAYAEHGYCKKGLLLLKEMFSKGLVSDADSCIAFLEACGNLMALETGKAVHAWIVSKRLDHEVSIGNAIVDMYGKCGCMEDAWAVFSRMQEKNWFSWNSMVAVYCLSGRSLEAIQMFLEMLQEGVKPNENTFTSVLNACGHAGFLEEGIRLLAHMNGDYGVLPTPEHHACVVRMLGRPGWLSEAEDYIHQTVPDEACVWKAFLAASRVHGDLERGKTAAEKICELCPQSSKSYSILPDLYEALGKQEDAARIRNSMVNGVCKERVRSSILLKNNTYQEFTTGDNSHEKSERIYAELQELKPRLQDVGIVADPKKLLMHEVPEERDEHSVLFHSEMLAIGMGLIKSSDNSPLRIIRNSGTCATCHSNLKAISKLLERKIIVRDGSAQLHHFANGVCTCKDYW